MKRIVFLCSLLAVFFLSNANPIEFKECIPGSGSKIDSWNFELVFDISKALEAAAVSNPGAEVGIGYMGYEPSLGPENATLYEGEPSDDIVLGYSLTEVVNGKSSKFIVNGDRVKFSFDSSIPIKNGQKYTIVVRNPFCLYLKGKTTKIRSTECSFDETPLTLEFFGDDLNSSQLYVENCSIESGSELESLNTLRFNLSSPFSIVDGGNVVVKDGNTVIASTSLLSVSETDQKQLTAVFEQPINLSYGKEYTIELPEGSVVLKGNTGIKNFLYQVKVKGTSAIYFGAKSHTPDGNGAILPETASIYFDVPDGKTLLPKSGKIYSGHTTCAIYTEGDEQNEIRKGGEVTSDGKGFVWDFSSFQFRPSTKYYLKKEKGTAYVFDENETQYPEFRNEEAIISWTTPSAEEAGFDPMEFDTPRIGKYGSGTVEYSEDMKISTLSDIQFGLKDKYYTYNGRKYNVVTHPDLMMGAPGYLYEVTDKGNVLVNTYSLRILIEESTYDVWNECFVSVNAPLYEGKKYLFVIPKGTYTIDLKSYEESDLSKVYYVNNPEIALTFIGTTPSEIKVASASIENNATCGSISNIVWRFEGDVKLRDEDQFVNYTFTNSKTGQVINSTRNVTLSGSYLKVDLTGSTSGKPEQIREGSKVQIRIPKGLLVYPTDETITNKEIVWTINGTNETSSAAAETVSVTVNVNGLHRMSHKAVKGEAYEFSLAHDNNWVVESVKHNGADVASANGTYTTAPLTESDNNIEASLKFAHNVSIADFTTGVEEVIADGSAISIGKDGDSVIVKGLKGGEHISVYSLNGMMVTDTIVGANMDSARISLPADSVLIILVESADESQAFKVKL